MERLTSSLAAGTCLEERLATPQEDPHEARTVRSRRPRPFALACVAAFAFPGAAARAAGLLIADGGLGGVLEIREHQVKAVVSDGIAVTEVEQVFRNTENRVVEALYTFPVPRGASVSGFSMWIGGKEMVGEVVEKQRARQIYESYKQTRRDPGLLEQVDYKRFELRIFPIAAGAEQRVRLSYSQEAEVDGDWLTYVYPLATTAGRPLDAAARGKFSLSLEVKSEIPMVEMESPSHREEFAIARHTEGYWQASLEAEGGDLSRDVVLAARLQRPRTGLDLVASRRQGEDGHLLLTLTAGKDLENLQKGMDHLFVLDVSGSMAKDGKLDLSRRSLAAFIDVLGPEDRFELIAFNVTPEVLFRSLAAAGQEEKARARQFLEQQRPRGGTVLRPALEAAYRYREAGRPFNVVVLSDGLTEPGEHRELLECVRIRPEGCRVFAIGVGNEVNGPLLKQMASDTGGLAAFISREDDFDRQAQAFRRKLVRPAAEGLKVTFEGAEVHDLEPAVLPSLYHGAPLRVYGRYRKPGPVQVTVEGQVRGEPFRKQALLELPAEDASHPAVDRMWALRRVESLMDEARKGGGQPAVDRIVELCEAYSITGEHASFIVLENDAEYRRWKIDRRNLARTERDRRALVALRQELEGLRRRSQEAIGPAGPAEAAPAVPVTVSAAAAAAPPAAVPGSPAPPPPPRRGFDFELPRGGGGALDPISVALALGLGALGLAAGRARRGRPTTSASSQP